MPNQLSPQAIKSAFESFDQSYEPRWKFPSKTELYRNAASSFAGKGSCDKFSKYVYPTLLKEFSVRRSPLPDALLPAPEIFSLLMGIKKDFPHLESNCLC